MIICDLSNNLLTVSLDGPECEQLARILFDASQGCRGSGDRDTAETLAGYFTLAAMVCKIDEGQAAGLDAIRKRIQGEEGPEQE